MIKRDDLWKKWRVYADEYDGEREGAYYDGASVMLDWLIMEFRFDIDLIGVDNPTTRSPEMDRSPEDILREEIEK